MTFEAETFIQFTVIFRNIDGSIISSNNYKYGNTVVVPKDPEGYSTETLNVYFNGWTPSVETICKGNAEYTATFREELRTYTVIFKDHDGTVLDEATYYYGDTVVVPDSPVRHMTDSTIYTFNGWDKEVVAQCTGDAVYMATYTETQRTYTVIFKDHDNIVLSTKTYAYGETIVVPNNPEREATNTTIYTFSGWDKEVVNQCAGDAVYTAIYTETQRTYTVIFKDYDGREIANIHYAYGDVIVVPENPTRAETNTTTYTFKAWNPSVETHCTADAEYTATYTETEKIYTVTVVDGDAQNINIANAEYTLPAANGVEGYEFLGWWNGTNLYNNATSEVKIALTQDMTVTAVYAKLAFKGASIKTTGMTGVKFGFGLTLYNVTDVAVINAVAQTLSAGQFNVHTSQDNFFKVASYRIEDNDIIMDAIIIGTLSKDLCEAQITTSLKITVNGVELSNAGETRVIKEVATAALTAGEITQEQASAYYAN